MEELAAGRPVDVRAVAQELVVGTECRDRRAQLVAHVGEEVAAPISVLADEPDRFLEPLGHGVELLRQLDQFARSVRVDRHLLMELTLGDRPGGAGQPRDRRGQTPDEPEAEEAREGEDKAPDEHEQPAHRRH